MTEIFILHGTGTTNILSWLGLVFGLLGTGIAFAVAWFQTLRKAKVIGFFIGFEKKQYVASNARSIKGEAPISAVKVVMLLKNIGARHAFIEQLRLKIKSQDGNLNYAYPVNFYQTHVGSDKHLLGLSLSSGEAFKRGFPFSFAEDLKSVEGEITAEVKFLAKNKWKKIKTNRLYFPECLRE